MTQYAIVTDLDRCVGCMACVTACKMANNVPIGNYWNKVLRIGPTPRYEGAQLPDVDMYFLPVGCQHCVDPECVKVCPTGASYKAEDGTVQIDKEKCIGCQFCAMSCPYNVRYLNEEERVVEKCTLCEQRTSQGGLPQCVINCTGRARWFGDLEQGIESFEALDEGHEWREQQGQSYDDMVSTRAKLGDYVEAFDEANVHLLTNVGNNPSFRYILRKDEWKGEE